MSLSIGDKVSVNYFAWSGDGEVVAVGSPYIRVALTSGAMKGRTGGFLANHIKLIAPVQTSTVAFTNKGIVAPQAPAVPPVVLTSGRFGASETAVFKIAKQIAVELGKRNRYVTSDAVQAELKQRGYSSNQLGNAAGQLFKGGLFQRTAQTLKSNRPEARGRRLPVWQYIGA